ncbi:Swd3p KNAG_0A03450 [Huiozyma naganishii CBS 8797]|uniref:Uncharacterized protein n=1 Tax=Huiozyma naganishii (strain ATCC MYA-139 / BCRC 22969 / CBS 8797 / KCTC 17520 / NBRC 10181 / NCYC 3082 / Yp74L-3) TaxID=1071383 RepID=J7REQ2_HUIN7|nr:hypothetical protein KNAG_0A03450 [Kazachstania naganishii CBS 8797]CCK68028.1 hypothetical protein KNAG_0A03450 [Kazachstania naganishii CBS 8797]
MFQLEEQFNVTRGATRAVFSGDGSRIAVACGRKVIVRDSDGGMQDLSLQHAGPVSDVAWSPDGECLATAADDFTVCVTHVAYGPLHRLASHTAPVVAVRYNSRGNLLYSASLDESIKVWDTLSGSLLKTISAHSEAVVAVDLPRGDDADCSLLASGSHDGLIRLFDSVSGHCLRTLTYDKDWQLGKGVVPVVQVQFTRNARFLLVRTLDGALKLWDCVNGTVVRSFPWGTASSSQLTHACGQGVLYTAEQPVVLAGGETGEIHCWDAQSKQHVQELQLSAAPVISIDCWGDTMVALTLDGQCTRWRWVQV